MRVLVVEDEVRLARNVAQALREVASFAVDIANDGEEGLRRALSNSYDLIVLDLMLPKVSGLEILAHLRHDNNRVPVLILTARNCADDTIKEPNAHSDDYLTKPFDMGQLIARCQALIHRHDDRTVPSM